MIDGLSKVVPLAIDLHEHLIQVPTPLRPGPKPIRAFPADLGRKHRAKPLPPEPDRFVTDIDAALVKQLLDIMQRPRKSDLQHHRQTNDLWTAVEVYERIASRHPQRLRDRPARLNRMPSETAVHTFDNTTTHITDARIPSPKTSNIW